MITNVPSFKAALLFCVACLLLIAPAQAQKVLEKLNRGVVAVRTSSNQVYVGWRLFGNDPSGIAFNVYRGAVKANAAPITNSTNFVDNTTANATYSVRPVVNGVEQAGSSTALVQAKQFLSVPLQVPTGGTTPTGEAYTYSPNDASVADLDGDGEYEIVLKWDPSNAKDNSQSGYTGNVYIDAYKLNGTRLWRIDLGRNIRAGAHYTQLMVYDLDSDGKAEISVKTADGTVDGQGVVIGNAAADYRNTAGYVLAGPEFMTVFNGLTGAAMATTAYLPARGAVSSWGDSYGNRVDRFISAIAYLDGQRPSLVMGRGYYTRLVRVAWDWRNGQLTHRWTFDSNDPGNGAYAGQGNHQLTVGDVDGDGKDEICNGASIIDDDGRGLYSTGYGHGDALHMTDMDPSRPGQEVWMSHETPSQYAGKGLQLRDARTGELLWGVNTTGDIGRAMAADIDPRHLGYEMWGSSGGLYNAKGEQIGTAKPTVNFGLWWDGDLQRELLDAGYNSTTGVSTVRLEKWNYLTNSLSRLLTPSLPENGTGQTINTTKANPCISADIFGDWREEFILRSADNTQLLIYTTTIPTATRIPTLMHDAQYRTQVALQNSAYNQPPHPSFYLGEGMTAPTYNISLIGAAITPMVSPASYLAPANAAAVYGKDIRLDWDGAADRYNVFVGSSPGALQLVAEGITQSEYLLAGANPLGTSYWRVDALKDGEGTRDGEVAVGSVWSFQAQDLVAPTVLSKDFTVTLVNGTASISGADVDNGSSDDYGIASIVASPATFTCATLGENRVTLTVADNNGNTATAAATVTVVGSIPTPSIAVTPSSTVYTGGVPTTLYLGYGPQAATLRASGGVSYQWSPAAGLSTAAGDAPVFTATAPGTYAYTVTATNEYGCTATATVTLTVINAVCGNKNDKVLLCHNGNTICIDAADVQERLTSAGYRDVLGACPGTVASAEAATAALARPTAFEAYPNPFMERTSISFQSAGQSAARLQVFNGIGQVVATLFDGVAEAGQAYTLTLESKGLPTGLYTCRLVLNGQVQTQKLMIVR
ncbi:T9SS type A sorting domain-containing protein [Hymenobacter arizonensis]|uniref:Por secretion system C-terminal sorting domain-containing protein n=1 Tax=Hymenobacter arizonensis TaxID=1227077 RepID=A0A1I6B5W4_HYMAR|nr:T9SS type A sorting domain-containing protein [Hymenobacter arizonensis]SFQ76187.1 Por secretion system C-terminal sorting domain-containing protein [Hymenobacter arizonensis]